MWYCVISLTIAVLKSWTPKWNILCWWRMTGSKDELSASHRSLSLASTGVIERGDCVEGRKIQNSALDKAELRLRAMFQRKDGINSIVSMYPELYRQLSWLKRLKVDWNFADKWQPLPRYRFSKYGRTQKVCRNVASGGNCVYYICNDCTGGSESQNCTKIHTRNLAGKTLPSNHAAISSYCHVFRK